LAISPAPLVVTAANASRLYGDPNPAFTGTIAGLKNGDNIGLRSPLLPISRSETMQSFRLCLIPTGWQLCSHH
jgi:hypothetical protein